MALGSQKICRRSSMSFAATVRTSQILYHPVKCTINNLIVIFEKKKKNTNTHILTINTIWLEIVITDLITLLIASACVDIGLLYVKWAKYSGLILCKLLLGTLVTSPCHDWRFWSIPKSISSSSKFTTTSHTLNVLHVFTWYTEKCMAWDKKKKNHTFNKRLLKSVEI